MSIFDVNANKGAAILTCFAASHREFLFGMSTSAEWDTKDFAVLFVRQGTSLRRAITRRRRDSKNAEDPPSRGFVSVLRISLIRLRCRSANVRKLLLLVVKQRDSDRETRRESRAQQREEESESWRRGCGYATPVGSLEMEAIEIN